MEITIWSTPLVSLVTNNAALKQKRAHHDLHPAVESQAYQLAGKHSISSPHSFSVRRISVLDDNFQVHQRRQAQDGGSVLRQCLTIPTVQASELSHLSYTALN